LQTEAYSELRGALGRAIDQLELTARDLRDALMTLHEGSWQKRSEEEKRPHWAKIYNAANWCALVARECDQKRKKLGSFGTEPEDIPDDDSDSDGPVDPMRMTDAEFFASVDVDFEEILDRRMG
jgi:hypothetical protein